MHGACRPVTQEQKDADPKAEENQSTAHLAHVKKGLAQLKVGSCCRIRQQACLITSWPRSSLLCYSACAQQQCLRVRSSLMVWDAS